MLLFQKQKIRINIDWFQQRKKLSGRSVPGFSTNIYTSGLVVTTKTKTPGDDTSIQLAITGSRSNDVVVIDLVPALAPVMLSILAALGCPIGTFRLTDR